ncbi:hypothetical protein ACWEPC_55385 [Nonomuraea sp. NPDC004297]
MLAALGRCGGRSPRWEGGILFAMRLRWVVTLVLVLVVGCDSSARYEVNATVLEEARKIGTVIWEEKYEDDTAEGEVIHLLVVDAKGDSEKLSFEKAVAFLQSHGWTIAVDDRPRDVSMDSGKWTGAHLTVSTFSSSEMKNYADVLEATRKAGVEFQGLVGISAFQGP